MAFFRSLFGVSVVAAIAGCASHPDSIKPAYVSPAQYEGYSCEQIQADMKVITRRSADLYEELRLLRNGDNWQTAAGALVFWPALLFLEFGDGPEANEFASLMGQFDALETVYGRKGCEFGYLSPEQLIEVSSGSD